MLVVTLVIFVILLYISCLFKIDASIFPSKRDREEKLIQIITSNQEKFSKLQQVYMVRYDPSAKVYNVFQAEKDSTNNPSAFKWIGTSEKNPVDYYFHETEQMWIERNQYRKPTFKLIPSTLDGETDILEITFSNGKKVNRKLNTKTDDVTVTSDGKIEKLKVACREMEEFTFGDYADIFNLGIDPTNRKLPVIGYRIKCSIEGDPILEKIDDSSIVQQLAEVESYIETK